MRHLLITAVCLLLSTASLAAATDPLEELHASVFTTSHDVTARLPHGRIVIHSAVVAFLPGLDRRTAGLVIGDVDVIFDSLPGGTGSLNLFAEMNSSMAGTKEAPLVFQVEAAYLNASTVSGAQVEPTGRATAIRLWNQLEDEEQQRFEDIYLQSYGDGWVRDAPQTDEGFRLRDPEGGEVYSAFWAPDPQVMPGAHDASSVNPSGVENPDGSVSSPIPGPRQLTRFDYRVLEDGETVTLEDYARGITLVQSPWAPEEGEPDANVKVNSAMYGYALETAKDGQPARATITARAYFEVASEHEEVSFLSYPWLGLPEVKAQDGTLYACRRGGPGRSDWVLSVEGDFKPGQVYDLAFPFGEVEIPPHYWGVGYAGVYRFDTGALIFNAADVEIDIWAQVDGHKMAEESPWQYSPGGQFIPYTGTASYVQHYHWDDSSRNCMVIYTDFPSREVPTTWGTLKVTAPAEMLDDTAQLTGVQSLEAMVDYFLRAWGDPRTGAPVPDGIPAGPYTLNVFFIPGESGVQAFEDAGMVFILGGQQSYGGQGGGQLPLIAHEVAHVWWGHGVAAPRWFTEGMANYAAAKFVEQYYGEGGLAAGQGDPLSYRRYLINFGLGSSIPVSLQRRDQLDDRAAIYHESAGFLLTADNRIAGGLDPVLAQLYTQYVNAPELSHTQLRTALTARAPAIDSLWDSMVEQGLVENSVVDDPTFRELVHTRVSRNYGNLLRWLNPVYRKRAAGDLPGAYYCAQRVLDYRRDHGDVLTCAELAFELGLSDESGIWLRIQPDGGYSERSAVREHWLLARLNREDGESQYELDRLATVAARGDSVGMRAQAEAARARIAELEAQGLAARELSVELADGDPGIQFALLEREYLALHANRYSGPAENDPFLLVGFVRGGFELSSITAVPGQHALRVGRWNGPKTDITLLQSFGSRKNIERELSDTEFAAPEIEGLRDMPGVTWVEGGLLHTDRRIYIPASELKPEVRAGLYDGTVQIVVLTNNMVEGSGSITLKIPLT